VNAARNDHHCFYALHMLCRAFPFLASRGEAHCEYIHMVTNDRSLLQLLHTRTMESRSSIEQCLTVHAVMLQDSTVKMLLNTVMIENVASDGVNTFFVDLLKHPEMNVQIARAADCIFSWLERAGLAFAELPPYNGTEADVCCTRNLFLYETYDFILRGTLVACLLKGVHGRNCITAGKMFKRIPPAVVMLYAAAHGFTHTGILEQFKEQVNHVYMKQHRILSHLFDGLPLEQENSDDMTESTMSASHSRFNVTII